MPRPRHYKFISNAGYKSGYKTVQKKSYDLLLGHILLNTLKMIFQTIRIASGTNIIEIKANGKLLAI